MSASTLRSALAALGLRCTVEEDARLAILQLDGDMEALADAALRATVTRLATEHGFTHVALELPVPAELAR